jgi:D-glucuronyl C5-epimerase C-terminus
VRLLLRLTTLLVALLATLPASALASDVIVVGSDGTARHTDDPLLPPPEATDPTGGEAYCAAPGQAAPKMGPLPRVRASRTTVKSALAGARKDGSIGNDDYARYRDDYTRARTTLGKLGGVERGEQKAVIDTLEAIAARKQLTASRMPSLFLTLRRNTEYWGSNKPLPVTPPPTTDPKKRPCTGDTGQGGARVTFEGDPVIFQWYRGRGLQIQQLATFGQANGLYQRCKDTTPDPARPCDREAFKATLDRLAELASNRGGFKTWEYYFAFGGGAPPWTSGLSQGTAIQAFARGYELLGDKRYKDVGHDALGAFEKAPPLGVRVSANGGSHYLIYSMSPGLRVLNGFLQATTGLYDFATLTGDAKARRLFKAGDKAARREVPRFDTGSWSLYSLGGRESDLGYHRLVRDFLDNLCDRTKVSVYCKTAKKFTNYQHQRVAVKVGTPKKARAKRPVTLGFSLSKISCTKITVVRNPAPRPPPAPDPQPEPQPEQPGETQPADPVSGGVTPAASPQTVYTRQIVFGRGGHAVQWTPRKPGKYAVTVEAIDLNNHKVQVESRFVVK